MGAGNFVSDKHGEPAVSTVGENGADGVDARSDTGNGISGISESNIGIYGQTNSSLSCHAGIEGYGGGSSVSVWGNTPGEGVGVLGYGGIGVSGTPDSGVGVSASGGSDGIALQVIGKISVQGDAAGHVIMAEGLEKLTVANPALTQESLVMLTPASNPAANLWVSGRNAGSFTISASERLAHDVVIMFLIIN